MILLTHSNFSIVLPVMFRGNSNFCTRYQGVPKTQDLLCWRKYDEVFDAFIVDFLFWLPIWSEARLRSL